MDERLLKVSSCGSVEDVDGLIESMSNEDRLELAQAAINHFIACNWCGKKESDLPIFDVNKVATLKKEAFNRLSFGPNTPFRKTRALECLLIAKEALKHCVDLPETDRLIRLQVLLTWQKVLEEPSVELMENIKKETASLDAYNFVGTHNEDLANVWLHRAEAHRIYFAYEKAYDCINKAASLTSLKFEVTGRVGRRTQWQRPLPQLILKTESTHTYEAVDGNDLPTYMPLNDDTLLETIQIEGLADDTKLSPVQLGLLLMSCNIQGKTCLRDDILIEECTAYLERILRQRSVWAVQCSALVLRSDMEKRNKRKVERACSQIENIIQLMDDSGKKNAEVWEERVKFVLISGLPPWWRCKSIYAQILISLGCISEALLQYEKLEDWSGVIDCYKALGQIEKAENLIRRLIEEGDKISLAYLYTLLGEITLETKYFDLAIESSGDRFARAQKSYGELYLAKKQYDLAFKHFQRSLQLQPIQLGVWYNAGYCAYQQKLYAEATSCFHRCVSLEPEHFEAWNNLSACYLQLDQKDRAKKILQEALKIDYEHPNVWENYLEMSLDTDDADQAILACHRILDIKKQLRDEYVLERARRILVKNFEQQNNEDVEKTKTDLLKLYARVATAQSLSSRTFLGYASLKEPQSNDLTEHSKYIQLLERAVLADTNKKDWWKEKADASLTLFAIDQLAAARLEEAKAKGGVDNEKQARAKNRLLLGPKISVVEKYYNELSGDTPAEIQEVLTQVKEKL